MGWSEVRKRRGEREEGERRRERASSKNSSEFQESD
jgi:hypothetical protein